MLVNSYHLKGVKHYFFTNETKLHSAVKGSWVARMGRNFDDYSGFKPKRSWANIGR